VQRPEPVGPDADLPLVIPPLPQRLQAVQSSYLGLEALAGLFPIHRLPDDASAREAARGARTALESARVRIGRIDADLRAALDGRVSATIPLLQDMERQREAVQRALRLADGPSAGAVDGAQGPDPARPRREARGLPGMREALRVASRCLTPWA